MSHRSRSFGWQRPSRSSGRSSVYANELTAHNTRRAADFGSAAEAGFIRLHRVRELNSILNSFSNSATAARGTVSASMSSMLAKCATCRQDTQQEAARGQRGAGEISVRVGLGA